MRARVAKSSCARHVVVVSLAPSSRSQHSPPTTTFGASDAAVSTMRVLVAIGFALRVFLWLISEGSNDIRTWHEFAQQIADTGLLNEYTLNVRFNHPPLMGLWSVAALHVSELLHAPFAHVFKLLPMAADVVAVAALVRVVGARFGVLHAWRAAAVFALCPVSIWVTAFHGNTDSACALLVFAGAALVDASLDAADVRTGMKRAFLAGLAFGAALDVKLLPLVCGPAVFIVQARDVKRTLAFCVGGALALVPFIAPLVVVTRDFYEHAIAYNSYSQRWGVHFFVDLLLRYPLKSTWAADDVALFDAFWAQSARYFILVASAAIGVLLRLRTRPPAPTPATTSAATNATTQNATATSAGTQAMEATALSMAAFLVLAPGMGVQYFVYPVLLLCSVDLRRAIFYAGLAGAFLTATYLFYTRGWFPMWSGHKRTLPPWLGFVGLPTWIALTEFVVSRVRSEWRALTAEVRT